jgi:hypothetical protein
MLVSVVRWQWHFTALPCRCGRLLFLFVADVLDNKNEIFVRARGLCPTGFVYRVIRKCCYYSSTRSLCAVPVAPILLDGYVIVVSVAKLLVCTLLM